MHRVRVSWKLLQRAVLLGVLIGALVPGVAVAETGNVLHSFLSGANVVPGPGADKASGLATVIASQPSTICAMVTASGVGDAPSAHIHQGVAGTEGPIVVSLLPMVAGSSSGCVHDVDRGLIVDMAKHPEQYYVAVHDAAHPSGAVRGQLAKRGGYGLL
jgi:hypothetical protein